MRLFSLALLFALGCGGDAKVVEICDNTLDDDLDGAVDCQDSDCLGSCPELCGDAVDNDGDGAADCADTDCDGACPEQCGDGRDNDADGLTDCDDSDCAGGCPEICGDGVDNDGDGAKDCDDPDCAGPECPEVCGNLLDDDGDGAIDCFDEDCDGSCPEDCTDGRDNDLDGDIDCIDRDCDGSCPEVCDDLRDNDGNGVADCNDPVCLPVCDADRDGFLTAVRGGEDCDDSDPLVNPDMQEVCNGKDDDCDFFTDDGDPDLDLSTRVLTYADEDGDGFGAGAAELRCLGPDRADNDDDCNDEEPAVYPGSEEICDDLDNDCDRLIDDADPDVQPDDFLTFYRDRDADGYGDPAGPTEEACSTPIGFADNDDDCDDRDPALGEPPNWLRDGDGDGIGAGAPVERAVCEPSDRSLVPDAYGEDCDDAAPSVYPGASEVCEDGIDQNCDGSDSPCILATFSELFTSGVTPTAACTSWNSFRAALPASGITEVTVNGDFDAAGVTCRDPAIAQGLANALRTGVDFTGSCDGNVWYLCARYSGELWINAPALCSGSNCPNPGRIIRPCIGNLNWGGLNTATCSAPTQRMNITFR